ncbi:MULTISPECIES: hypothetical protein [Fibrobacter]|uniref:hypothetical protein n=1 Tax=Fibrobacter TaxID=832 RepID=UPI000B52568E|nr:MULTISPECIES: hypothetical protein [Fibrobacter]OWV20436.1 hypothetical protein B7990_04545 [Fibrobacter sp. UWB4]
MKIKLLFFGLVCIAILFSYTSYKVISQTNVTDTTNENSAIQTDNSASKLELISLNDTILEQIIHKPLTRYRALNFNKDTTVWDTSDCKIGKSTFSCNHIERHNYSFGVRDDIRLEIFGDKFKKRSSHKKIIYDTTYIDINFGKNALVHYTPIAEIPKLNRDAVAKALSKLSGKRCSQIFEFRSNYNLEVIGLSGFSWKNRKDEILGYDAYIDRNDSDQEMCSVQGSRDQYTMSSHYSLIYRKSLPEQLDDKRLQFFNGTLKSFQDTTISWKLVYTDQYHRTDTLNITTKFEYDDSDSLSSFRNRACYDAIKPSNCK